MDIEVKKEDPRPIEPFTFDTNAVMFVLYLFYKSNIITRHHLRSMMKTIKEPLPEDVIKFIAQEAKKAT